jgi:hypothetical protein
MLVEVSDPPIGHVDDPSSVAPLLEMLHGLHPGYQFAVGSWDDTVSVDPVPGRVVHRFVVSARGAGIELQRGDRVRGAPAEGPYARGDDGLAEVTAAHREALWPGDVVCVSGDHRSAAVLHGSGTYFDVVSETTGYVAARLAMLRNLPDKPGGCAAYPGAFRREALPPRRPDASSVDQRGENRVNEHTLDMRFDREPPSIRHYHGPVRVGEDRVVNHSETAIVLSRSVYGLPEPDAPDQGRVVIYRRPAEDTTDQVVVTVRPGTMILTPASTEHVMGHAFENCFAMLIAIPGFVAPYHFVPK